MDALRHVHGGGLPLWLTAVVLAVTVLQVPAAVAAPVSPAAQAPVVVPATGAFLWRAPALDPAPASVTYHVVAGPNGSVYALTDAGDGVRHSELFVSRLRASDGAVVWRTGYQGPGDQFADGHALATAPNGDAVVIASQKAAADAAEQWVVLRYRAADGKLLWSVVRSGPTLSGAATSAVASGLAVDRRGAVYVAGTEGALPGASSAAGATAVAVKYSSSGRQVWKRVLAAPLGSGLSGIAVDRSGNSFVTGWRQTQLSDPAAGLPEVTVGVVRRLDRAGHPGWERTFGGSGYCTAEHPLLAGKWLCVCGPHWQLSVDKIAGPPFVAMLSVVDGKTAWTTDLEDLGGEMETPTSLAVDGHGDPVVGGSMTMTYPTQTGYGVGDSGWVCKLAAAGGDELWRRLVSRKTADGYAHGNVQDVAADDQGRVYCAAIRLKGGSATVSQGAVWRFDASGGSPVEWSFGDSGVHSACYSVLVAGDGVYAAGGLASGDDTGGFVRRLKP